MRLRGNKGRGCEGLQEVLFVLCNTRRKTQTGIGKEQGTLLYNAQKLITQAYFKVNQKIAFKIQCPGAAIKFIVIATKF